MAPDFGSYLTTEIVSEKRSVTYRNVSRALKVHVNAAKCMLFEFYEKENNKRPESIYATYLIAGTKKQVIPTIIENGVKDDDEDEPMPSSPPPFMSSMLDPSQHTDLVEESLPVPVKTISLVREETLNDIRQQYEKITSIHIYSLSPGRLQDLVVLTDVGRDLFTTTFVKEDPLQHNKTYGVIQNPLVRRRKGKRSIIPEATQPKFKPVLSEKPVVAEPKATAKAGSKENSRPSSRDSTPTAQTKPLGTQPKTASLKRDDSSLFKAFAKQSSQSKLKRKDSDASTNASASQVSDIKMTDADEEGESEDEALFLDTNTKKAGSKKRTTDAKKDREDKAAKLRKMMESDDEAESEVPSVAEATDLEKDPVPTVPDGFNAEAEAEADVDWSESDTENPQSKSQRPKPEPEEPISTAPKRRRGKRKIMKKRTTKDEDGYLVTKEEPVWESFSEDEPEPVAPIAVKERPKSAFSGMKNGTGGSNPSSQKSNASGTGTGTGATGGSKGAAGAKKKGGDIMSFFGKK